MLQSGIIMVSTIFVLLFGYLIYGVLRFGKFLSQDDADPIHFALTGIWVALLLIGLLLAIDCFLVIGMFYSAPVA